MKKIIGIDPGSRSAGFGVIEVEGKKFKYIDSGTLKYKKNTLFLHRLGEIHRSCLEMAEKYAPDDIVFESLIYVKSPAALMKLAQARGAMIAAFSQTHENKIYEYAPTLIKQAVAGHGHADKQGIQKMLGPIFGVDMKNFSGHDETDGLAIAICHGLLAK